MNLTDLTNLTNLLRQLEGLEKVIKENEILKKENEELKEYKRRYNVIESITKWGAVIEEKEQLQGLQGISGTYQTIPTNIFNDEATISFDTKPSEFKTNGEWLIKLRRDRRMSLKEVSKESGLSTSSLWEMEQDKHKPHLETLKKAENYYKIKLVY